MTQSGTDAERKKEETSFADSIDAKINKFWGPIFEFDYSKELEPQKKKYEQMLIKKYGKEIINEFKLKESLVELSPEKLDEHTDFLYSTGLYEDGSPEYNYIGREIFRMAVKYLKNTKIQIPEPASLIDLGSGDGKLLLGFKQFLPDMQFVGVESACAAVKKTHELFKLYNKCINDSVKLIEKNYCSVDFIENMVQNPPTFAFFCRPYSYDAPLLVMHEFAEAGIKIIGGRPINTHEEANNQETLKVFLSSENIYLNHKGINFKLLNYKRTSPTKMVVLGEYSII